MSDTPTNLIGDAPDAGTGVTDSADPAVVSAPVEGADKSNVAEPDPAKDPVEPEKVAAGAPEKYSEFKMPEGVEFTADIKERAEPLFRDLNLTQEQAEKAAHFLAAENALMAAKAEEGYKAYQAELVAAAKADKEIGGTKLAESAGQAKQFIQRFGRGEKGAEALKVLDDLGAGNHPVIISLFAKAFKAMSEDSPSGGAPNATEEKPPLATLLFGKVGTIR